MANPQRLVFLLIGIVALIALLMGYFQNSLPLMIIAVFVLVASLWIKELW